MGHWPTVVAAILVVLSQTTATLHNTCFNTGWTVLTPATVLQAFNSAVWISTGPWSNPSQDNSLNITARLQEITSESSITLEEKLVILQDVTPVELSIPSDHEKKLKLQFSSHGGLSQTEDCSQPDVSLRVLDPVKSLGLKLDKGLYQPGQVVSIWIGALDYNGRMVSDIKVQVTIQDPNNVTMRLWNSLLLPPGLTNLQFQLSDSLNQGLWNVQATVNQLKRVENFHVAHSDKNPIRVSLLSDPIQENREKEEDDQQDMEIESQDTTAPLAESHFVELNFSPRTVSFVNPGSPITGQLTASTSERGILVRLDLLNENGISVHQEMLHFNQTSSLSFSLPSGNVSTNATIQATLESVEGQSLDNKFLLATHKVSILNGAKDWQCLHLSSGNDRYTLQEGDVLDLIVSIACNTTLNRINYVVTYESGHVISWGQEYFVNGTRSSDDAVINLSIPITYEMIPRSVVTVFFNDDNGTLLIDSMDIFVENTQEEKVTLMELKGNQVRVNLTLTAGSHHCLYGSWQIAGRTSVDKMTRTTTTTGTSSTMRTDESVIFLPKFDSLSHFDFFGQMELWSVSCFDPSELLWKETTVTLPAVLQPVDMKPILRLVTFDPDGKIRKSRPLHIVTRDVPWEIDLQLPPTVRVGEELIIDLAVKSSLGSCSQTQLQMALTGGATFTANSKKFLQQPACLPPNSKSIYRVGVRANQPDLLTLTVQLKGSSSMLCCTWRNSTTVIDLDSQEAQLLETLPLSKSSRILESQHVHQMTQDYLFCLGEEAFVSNGSSFAYKFLPLSSETKSIVFQVLASADVRIVLGDSTDSRDSYYHLILGGEDNMYSWISAGSNGLLKANSKVSTPKLLRQDRLQTFWISWQKEKLGKKRIQRMEASWNSRDTERLSVGKGSHVGVRTLLSVPLDSNDQPFRFIGFSTGWGSTGYFRVWGTSGVPEQTTRTFMIPQPTGVEPHDQRAEITIKGGIVSGLEALLSSPPQDAVSSLTTLLEAFYRDGLKRIAIHQNEANQVLQSILKYRSDDGSFHNGDAVADLRFTAMTFHTLSLLRSLIYVDPVLLTSSLNWMHTVQGEDGSFSLSPSSTTSEKITTTSFILNCLSDIQHDDIVFYQILSAGQRYLERQLISSTDIRQIPPLVSALLVTHSSTWPLALHKLDSIYSDLIERYRNQKRDWLDVMTHALTAYFHHNKPDHYIDLVKTLLMPPWNEIHPLDKIRSMKMWMKYGHAFNEPVRNLHVRLSFQYGNLTEMGMNVTQYRNLEEIDSVEIPSLPPSLSEYESESLNDTNIAIDIKFESLEEFQNIRLHTPPLTYDIPSIPQNVEFSIAGTGCATLQTRTSWKSAQPSFPELSDPFTVNVTIYPEGVLNQDEEPPRLQTAICIGWNGTQVSDLVIAQVEMFSSYVITNIAGDKESQKLSHSVKGSQSTIYIDPVEPGSTKCFKVNLLREGLIRNIQPGRIKIYQKNHPERFFSTTFSGFNNTFN